MTDLLYECKKYLDELNNLFDDAKISDASDEIHVDRVMLEYKIDKWEARRILFLNGFAELSLDIQLSFNVEKTEWLNNINKWKVEYPEYFKEEN